MVNGYPDQTIGASSRTRRVLEVGKNAITVPEEENHESRCEGHIEDQRQSDAQV